MASGLAISCLPIYAATYASGLPFLRQPKQTQYAEVGGEERKKMCGEWSGGTCSGFGRRPGYPKSHLRSRWALIVPMSVAWSWASETQQY